MALAMREAASALIAKWRRRGRELGVGAGIAQGYATLGQIGFAERSSYTAIGTVCNLAAAVWIEKLGNWLGWLALRTSRCLRSGLRPARDDGQIGTSVCRVGALRDVECRDRTAKTS